MTSYKSPQTEILPRKQLARLSLCDAPEMRSRSATLDNLFCDKNKKDRKTAIELKTGRSASKVQTQKPPKSPKQPKLSKQQKSPNTKDAKWKSGRRFRKASDSKWFTEGDSMAIQDSWKLRQNNTDCPMIGLSILTKLLSKSPMWARMFKVDASMTEMELAASRHVQVQGNRIEMFLNNLVIALVHAPETTVRSLCRRLGLIHYERNVTFDSVHWEVFKDTCIQQIIGTASIGQCYVTLDDEKQFISVWAKLLQVIQDEMTRGYLLAANQKSLPNEEYHVRRHQTDKLLSISRVKSPYHRRRNSATMIQQTTKVKKPLKRRRSIGSTRNLPKIVATTSPIVLIGTTETENRWIHHSVHVLNQLWRNINNYKLCSDLFFCIVAENLQFACRFHLNQNEVMTNRSQIAEMENVRRQISHFHTFFSTIFEVATYVPPDHISRHCRRMGEIHFLHGINFTTESWLQFKRLIVNVFTKAAFSLKGKTRAERLELERVIGRFVQFLVHEMKAGFVERVLTTFTLKRKPSDLMYLQRSDLMLTTKS